MKRKQIINIVYLVLFLAMLALLSISACTGNKVCRSIYDVLRIPVFGSYLLYGIYNLVEVLRRKEK